MSIVTPFLIGSIIGAAFGAQFVIALPKYLLQIVLAVFILASTWAPNSKVLPPVGLNFLSSA
jgi:uncharacterized membrane protein YfcA